MKNTTVQPLLRVLSLYGFELTRSEASIGTIHYGKCVGSKKYGTQTFTVRILGSRFKSGYAEQMDFKSCELLGPVVDPRTGVLVPHQTLGSWSDFDTAMQNVLIKYASDLQAFQAAEANRSGKSVEDVKTQSVLGKLQELLNGCGYALDSKVTEKGVEIIVFKQSIRNPHYGYLTYTVRVELTVFNGEFKFLGCELWGPVLNLRTKAFSPTQFIKGWDSMAGALSVNQCAQKHHKELMTKLTKLYGSAK